MVPENTTVGTVLYVLIATDADAGSNGSIMSFELVSQTPLFSVASDSGAIILEGNLDHEMRISMSARGIERVRVTSARGAFNFSLTSFIVGTI